MNPDSARTLASVKKAIKESGITPELINLATRYQVSPLSARALQGVHPIEELERTLAMTPKELSAKQVLQMSKKVLAGMMERRANGMKAKDLNPVAVDIGSYIQNTHNNIGYLYVVLDIEHSKGSPLLIGTNIHPSQIIELLQEVIDNLKRKNL